MKRGIMSMTGFGRGEAAFPGGRATVEVRSVNSRFLDVAVRLPALDTVLEEELRKAVRGVALRGRLELFIKFDVPSGFRRLNVDRELAVSYYENLKELAEALCVEQRFLLDTLATLPGVFSFEEAVAEPEVMRAAALEAAGVALGRMAAMREEEGRALAADMVERLRCLDRLTAEMAERAPAVVDEHRRRLADRLAVLIPDGTLDEGRLVLELALLAERSDIAEELVRLHSHIRQAGRLLEDGAGVTEGVGRRLDFLLQEMNRELNTVAAKAGDLAVATAAVGARVEVEKLREQVQNVE